MDLQGECGEGEEPVHQHAGQISCQEPESQPKEKEETTNISRNIKYFLDKKVKNNIRVYEKTLVRTCFCLFQGGCIEDRLRLCIQPASLPTVLVQQAAVI